MNLEYVKNDKTSEILYLLNVIVIVICGVLLDTFVQYTSEINIVMTSTIIFVSFLILLRNKYDTSSFKIFINILLIATILFLLVLRVNFVSNIILILLMFTGQNVKPEKTAKVIFITSLLAFLFVILSYYFFSFNVANDYLSYRMYTTDSVFRRSLGFSTPNRTMLHWIIIVLSYAYIQKKIRISNIIFVIIGSFEMYKLTDSRTGFYLIVFLILMQIIISFKLRGKPGKMALHIISLIPMILTIISLIVTVCYNSAWINNLFSGRIYLYEQYFQQYKITMLGNVGVENMTNFLPLDNSYIYILLSKGIIYYILFFGIVTLVIRKGRNIIDWNDIAIFILVIIYAVTETLLNKLDITFILIILGNKMFYSYKYKKAINKTNVSR